jgi:hypothetical protein
MHNTLSSTLPFFGNLARINCQYILVGKKKTEEIEREEG